MTQQDSIWVSIATSFFCLVGQGALKHSPLRSSTRPETSTKNMSATDSNTASTLRYPVLSDLDIVSVRSSGPKHEACSLIGVKSEETVHELSARLQDILSPEYRPHYPSRTTVLRDNMGHISVIRKKPRQSRQRPTVVKTNHSRDRIYTTSSSSSFAINDPKPEPRSRLLSIRQRLARRIWRVPRDRSDLRALKLSSHLSYDHSNFRPRHLENHRIDSKKEKSNTRNFTPRHDRELACNTRADEASKRVERLYPSHARQRKTSAAAARPVYGLPKQHVEQHMPNRPNARDLCEVQTERPARKISSFKKLSGRAKSYTTRLTLKSKSAVRKGLKAVYTGVRPSHNSTSRDSSTPSARHTMHRNQKFVPTSKSMQNVDLQSRRVDRSCQKEFTKDDHDPRHVAERITRDRPEHLSMGLETCTSDTSLRRIQWPQPPTWTALDAIQRRRQKSTALEGRIKSSDNDRVCKMSLPSSKTLSYPMPEGLNARWGDVGARESEKSRLNVVVDSNTELDFKKGNFMTTQIPSSVFPGPTGLYAVRENLNIDAGPNISRLSNDKFVEQTTTSLPLASVARYITRKRGSPRLKVRCAQCIRSAVSRHTARQATYSGVVVLVDSSPQQPPSFLSEHTQNTSTTQRYVSIGKDRFAASSRRQSTRRKHTWPRRPLEVPFDDSGILTIPSGVSCLDPSTTRAFHQDDKKALGLGLLLQTPSLAKTTFTSKPSLACMPSQESLALHHHSRTNSTVNDQYGTQTQPSWRARASPREYLHAAITQDISPQAWIGAGASILSRQSLALTTKRSVSRGGPGSSRKGFNKADTSRSPFHQRASRSYVKNCQRTDDTTSNFTTSEEDASSPLLQSSHQIIPAQSSICALPEQNFRDTTSIASRKKYSTIPRWASYA